jgi:ParB/RepB/Spo0J family partition protein
MQINDVKLKKTVLESKLVYLPVHLIDPNPQQPRIIMYKGLYELAESIKKFGVLEPVLACQDFDRYMLVAGHRRFAAAKMAGLEKIPALLLPARFLGSLGAAVAENMLREELNCLEMAEVVLVFEKEGLDRKDICINTGLSLASVSELFGLNNIPQDVRNECLLNGHLSKRILIQLSLIKGDDEIRAAYDFFKEHRILPPRQKRNYKKVMAKDDKLKALIKFNQCLDRNGTIEYSADSEDSYLFRAGIIQMLQNLKRGGWFIPSEFDATNMAGSGATRTREA